MIATSLDVPAGYKQTDFGIIPEDWQSGTLGEFLAFQNGVNADKSAYGHGTLFINVLEVLTYPYIREEQIAGRVSLPEHVARPFNVEYGDVLFNRTSETQEEVGLASVFIGAEDVIFGGFVVRGRPRDKRIHPLYSPLLLRTPSARSQIIAMGQGAVRANIGQRQLSRVEVFLPPKAEQQAIAEALGDADAWIESLEQLVAKKRHLKQAAMQHLLTGKTRLPGFEGEWEQKPLSELADIRSGGTPSTTNPDYWDGDVLWCTPTDITGLNGSKYLSGTSRKITQTGLKYSSAEIIPSRSIVMTSRATIGECAINTSPVSTNQGFKNFVPFDDVDVEFLYYLLGIQKQGFISLCGGSTFLEIGKTQLAAYEVELPGSKTEQYAISEVLSDMDGDIAATEAKLSKARQIKQGMMQELLTGRIRLV